eukprot:8741764-Ditylum_brightwellii.AAC.1
MGCIVDVANNSNSILEESKRSLQSCEVQEEQSRSLFILLMDCVGVADLGKIEAVLAAKEEMKKHFECENLGEMTEHVGCKVDRDNTDG